MHSELSLKEMKKEWHGSLTSYVIGFSASLILTSLAFLLVVYQVLEGKHLVYAIIGLALLQALFQLIFFLHVGQEAKPKWETLIFCFMFFILLIVSIGSMWIMNDLNERMMPNMDMHDMQQGLPDTVNSNDAGVTKDREGQDSQDMPIKQDN